MCSVKLLKGFRNPINNEINTISLLLKSNLDLNEHIKSIRPKLLNALTCISENYGNGNNVCFHHKIVIAWHRCNDYLATRDYLIKLDNLEKNLNSSLKETIRITRGKRVSHFVNIQISPNDDIDEVLELSKKEIVDINSKVMSSISIRNDEYIFIDNNEKVKPSKNNEKVTSVKPIKKAIPSNECLFIDSDDNDDNVAQKSGNAKRYKKKDYTKRYKNECLFVDDDAEQKKVENNECLFVDEDD